MSAPDGDEAARVAQALAASLLDWAVTGVAAEAHRARALRTRNAAAAASAAAGADAPAVADTPATAAAARPPPGPPPTVLFSDKNVSVECSNCGYSTAASRYAQHLEKCLGRGGRPSSRAASARLKKSAENAEKEALADLHDDPPPVVSRKRRLGADAVAASKVEDTMFGDLPPLPAPPRNKSQ